MVLAAKQDARWSSVITVLFRRFRRQMCAELLQINTMRDSTNAHSPSAGVVFTTSRDVASSVRGTQRSPAASAADDREAGSVEPAQDQAETKGAETALSPVSLTPEAVCREFAQRIYRLAMRMLCNETDAEDVTQEVLLQVVRKIDTFRGESSLGTWLHRVTANAALALRRKRATCRERQLDALRDGLPIEVSDDGRRRRPACGPEEQAQTRELSALIEEATAELPEIYREVFVLSDVQELSNAEIGSLLGLSLPAVKSRLHRARLLLRHSLASRLGEGAT